MASTDHHTALIYTMVLLSAADRDMTDEELKRIGEIVRTLPVFRDYDQKRLAKDSAECAKLLAQENGLERTLKAINQGLPKKLKETAYAIACDVAAADLHASQEELRLLQMLRYELKVPRLDAAAIERGSRARHMTL